MPIRYALALAFAVLWLGSFALPAVESVRGWHRGWEIASAGWAGIIIAQFGWYANPIMIPALGYLALAEDRDRKNAIGFGLVLLAFGINSFFWSAFYWDSGAEPILARSYGYYAWMVAVIGTGAGLLVVAWRNRRKGKGMGLSMPIE